MALTFPSSPSNGQLYTDTVTGYRYIYNATAGVWSFSSNNVGMSVSSTPPSNVAPGSMWFNREIGRTFVYYDDGDSKQWIETVPAGAVDTNVVAGYVNPVFASMNTAYATANGSYATANAAYSQANSFVGVYGVANAAFGKANNALANTSGIYTAGDLVVPGNFKVGTGLDIAKFNVSHPSSGNSIVAYFGSSDSNYTALSIRNYPALNLTMLSTEWNTVATQLAFGHGGGEKMRIDSSGRVTKPYQPAFCVSIISAATSPTIGVMTYNTTITSDPSSSINLGTGRFTAPVSGKYYFSFVSFSESNSTNPQAMFLRINGTTKMRVYNSNGSDYRGLSTLSGVFSLSAGDYADVYIDAGKLHNNENCYFSGYLIG